MIPLNGFVRVPGFAGPLVVLGRLRSCCHWRDSATCAGCRWRPEPYFNGGPSLRDRRNRVGGQRSDLPARQAARHRALHPRVARHRLRNSPDGCDSTPGAGSRWMPGCEQRVHARIRELQWRRRRRNRDQRRDRCAGTTGRVLRLADPVPRPKEGTCDSCHSDFASAAARSNSQTSRTICGAGRRGCRRRRVRGGASGRDAPRCQSAARPKTKDQTHGKAGGRAVGSL